jgi:archaellum component FlaC
MDVKEYCDNMGKELSTWKDEIGDILKAVEKFPEKEKERVSPQIGALRALVEDISAKIERLKNECPLDWSAMANELQRQVTELRKQTSVMWDLDHIAGGYVGG